MSVDDIIDLLGTLTAISGALAHFQVDPFWCSRACHCRWWRYLKRRFNGEPTGIFGCLI
jgi:hypothetical protein